MRYSDRCGRGKVKVGNLVDEETKLTGLSAKKGVETVCIVFRCVESRPNAAACRSLAWILVCLIAGATYSFSVIMVPRSFAFSLTASVTACSRFNGPSALSAVAGLMAPTTTTGLLEFTASCKKKAVSSRVSVP